MEKSKTYTINTSSDIITEILKDLQSYGNFHPLIRKVEKLSSSESGTLYKITERPFKWIPYNIKYTADLTSKNSNIQYEISGMPLTKAYISYQLIQKSKKQTSVQFQLIIASKLPGSRLLLNKMISAQDQLMNSINKSYEIPE